jgi:dTDP-glucose pyrophosphorylase
MNGAAIILAAGAMDYRHLPLGTNLSNAMIPVNGRPVIGWILDDLAVKGIREATIVHREEDVRLREFVEWAYQGRMTIRMATVAGGGSILDSLAAGLGYSEGSGPVRVILGDTLIRDPFEGGEDFVYVAPAEGARRWCLAVTDRQGRVVDYIDKDAGAEGVGPALAGYYHLTDRGLVLQTLRSCREEGIRELSGFLRRYGKERPIVSRQAREWFDFGHIDNLVDARRRLLSPRSFNSLRVDPVFSTITKSSENTEKLEDELTWYLELPDRLKILAPRVIAHRRVDGRLEITQEYYGYPSLAELFVFGEMPPEFWASVLRRLFAVLSEFGRHPGELSPAHLREIYLGKTVGRLERLQKQDDWWRRLLNRKSIRFNGMDLPTPRVLGARLEAACLSLASTARTCVIHGDFCFSNILFDINTQVVKLIDPRGRFGVRGIHGDPRYDVAKLRHSVAGLYDFIVADMFSLEEVREGEFEGRILRSDDNTAVVERFEELARSAGFQSREVRLIEGLLFLSMVPLHADHPARQRMMFLKGLETIHGVLEEGAGA